LVLAGLAACDDDGPLGPIPGELAATWSADRHCMPTCAFHVYTTSQPPDSLNLLTWDYRLEFTLERDGGFRMRSGMGSDTTYHGTATISAPWIIVVDAASGSTDSLRFELDGRLLELWIPSPFPV